MWRTGTRFACAASLALIVAAFGLSPVQAQRHGGGGRGGSHPSGGGGGGEHHDGGNWGGEHRDGGWGGYYGGGWGYYGRGWGDGYYGWNRPYYGWGRSYYYGPSYYDYGYAPSYDYGDNYSYGPAPEGYTTFYRGDTGSDQGAEQGAMIDVRVPANAEVWVDGKRTQQRGEFRRFSSPALEGNQTFTYELRARWNDDGKPVDQTRTITVRAGDHKMVNFMARQGGGYSDVDTERGYERDRTNAPDRTGTYDRDTTDRNAHPDRMPDRNTKPDRTTDRNVHPDRTGNPGRDQNPDRDRDRDTNKPPRL